MYDIGLDPTTMSIHEVNIHIFSLWSVADDFVNEKIVWWIDLRPFLYVQMANWTRSSGKMNTWLSGLAIVQHIAYT